MSINQDEDRREVVRVAVIGIGSAGLGQLKQLKDTFERDDVKREKRLEVVGFETREDVGGIWNHDPTPEPFVTRHIASLEGGEQTYIYPKKDQNPTAVYDGLRALLPHDLMAFRDLPFPEGTVLFPPGSEVCEYIQRYATVFDLRRYIRFSTRVERLHQDPRTRVWTVESFGTDGRRVEEFDHVSVCNGHYNDPWLPRMPGLSTFPGRVIHSREYRRATDYAGQTVLVIGSFSSGSDIARLVAGLNVSHYHPDGSPVNGHKPALPYTKVYQSTTGTTNKANVEDPSAPWWPYIHKLPMIHHFEPASDAHPRGRIHFKGDPPAHVSVDDVDVVIFCTGYNNALPFAKAEDYPWNEHRVLEQAIRPEEREGGDEWEAGGLRGLYMRGLDPMLIFLENDRSIAFVGLPYSIVPFPFSEVQARLVAYHWANLVALPKTLSPPLNSCNKYYDPITRTTPGMPNGASPDGVVPDLAGSNEAVAKVRFSLANRREFVFPHPYEWEYCDYVFDLLRSAERDDVKPHWTGVEAWRREKRGDEGLRKRTLGY